MPADIEFSPHSLLKIEILKSHGFNVTKEIVEEVIRNPDRIDAGYHERLIAQKDYDDIHVFRVVYEVILDKKYIVTIYPGRRSRYAKD